MLVESFVMLAIISAVILMSCMKNKKDAALEMTPLLFLPAMYIIGNYICTPLSGVINFSDVTVFTGIIVLAATVSSLFVGFFTGRFKRKYTKAMYSIMAISFNLVLMLVYIINLWDNIPR